MQVLTIMELTGTEAEGILFNHFQSYTNRSLWEPSQLFVEGIRRCLNVVSEETKLALAQRKFAGGRTFLHRAAQDDLTLLKCLLDSIKVENKHALLLVQDEDGKTSLHYASQSWNADTVKYALESIAPENRDALLMVQDNKGMTSLHCASQSGDADKVKYTLESIAPANRHSSLMLQDNEGMTSLHCASQSGNADTVKYVLESIAPENRDASLMVQDNEGMTSLHYASDSGDADEVKYTLESIAPENRHALLMLQDNKGLNSLHYASQSGVADIVKYVLESISPENRLASLMLQDNEGMTLLHYASQSGNANTVKCVLESIAPENRHASLMVQDNQGLNSLHYASQSCNADTVKNVLEFISPENRLASPIVHGNEGISSISYSNDTTSRDYTLMTGLQGSGQSDQNSLVTYQREGQNSDPFYDQLFQYPLLGAMSRYKNIVNSQFESTSFPPVDVSTSVLSNLPPALQFPSISPLNLSAAANNFSSSLTQTTYFPTVYLHSTTVNCYPSTTAVEPTLPSSLTPPPHPLPSTPVSVLENPHSTFPSALQTLNVSMSAGPSALSPEISNTSNNTHCSEPSLSLSRKRCALTSHSNDVEHSPSFSLISKHESKIEGSTVKLQVNDKRLVFMFQSSRTVKDFTAEVQETTGFECTISSQDGYGYTGPVTLGALTLPFIISAGNSKTLITSSREDIEQVDSSCSDTSSAQGSASSTSKFSRVSNVSQVIELLTSVHEHVKGGMTINQALKATGKDRKTAERFKNIYYLHVTNSSRLRELDQEWTRGYKKVTHQEFDKKAEEEIDWDLLQRLADEGKVTLFGAIKEHS